MRLVKESGKTAAQLSRETGLGQRWMYMLMQGAYSDPGVNKIEQLHDHLDVNKWCWNTLDTLERLIALPLALYRMALNIAS